MNDLFDDRAIQTAELRRGWLRHLEGLGKRGHFVALGKQHWSLFEERGPKLLVSFESFSQLLQGPFRDMPVAQQLAAAKGWSHLSLLADGRTWYRNRRVWSYLDRLVDDGFFEDFDQVTFYGAGMGGYAACAFSVVAPGARVLAIRPVATLDPRFAGWDHRYTEERRADFRSRYGYGPDMIDAAAKAWIIHDPAVDEDAMHAALYRKKHVNYFDCRHLGPAPEGPLDQMGVLVPLIQGAVEGTLDASVWSKLWRARRGNPIWLRNVAARLAESHSRLREGRFLRLALEEMEDAPRLKRRYGEVQRALEQSGQILPQPLRRRARG